MNTLKSCVLLIAVVGLISGCESLKSGVASGNECRPFSQVRTVMIHANPQKGYFATPPEVKIRAGGVIGVTFDGSVDVADNIEVRWDGTVPTGGKDASWINKGNAAGIDNAVIFVPCDAGPDSGTQKFVDYKYQIVVGGSVIVDPRIQVEPPN